MRKRSSRTVEKEKVAQTTVQPEQQGALSDHVHETLSQIQEMLGNSSDLVTREIVIRTGARLRICLLYLGGLVDEKTIQDNILQSIFLKEHELVPDHEEAVDVLDILKTSILTVPNIQDVTDVTDVCRSLLAGKTVLLFEGYRQGFAASTEGWDQRGVQEPSTQTVIRGPREAFNENISTNVALVRRKIQDPSLRIESYTIGSLTHTKVSVMYLNHKADEHVVAEVRTRLQKIDVESILESGYIEEQIQDNRFSPFPTVYNTERPDIVAAGLLEGRVAILVDGTPFVLLVPALFVQFFQSAEDYYQRYDFSTFVRLLRYFCLIISFLGPSLYIAIGTFHNELIPTSLLINLAAQREGVPFPQFLEVVMMEVTFEILREAGIRMPRAVGQALSIVGALVIGQSAVEAGLVAPAMVVVVGVTAIANLAMPAFNIGITFRMLRFVLMCLAASFGLFGIAVGVFAMILHLSSLESFGVPYLYPMTPFALEDQRDTLIRMPRWKAWVQRRR